MSAWDDLLERLDEISSRFEDGQIPLNALPIRALQERLEDTWNVDADKLILPQSVHTDELAPVPTAKRHHEPVQSIPNITSTEVALDTEDWNINMVTQGAPGRIKAQVPGIYLCIGSVSLDTGGAVGAAQMSVNRNGGLAGDGTVGATIGEASAISPIKLVNAQLHPLRAGDYVSVWFWQGTGAARNTLSEGELSEVPGNETLMAIWVGQLP